MPPTSPRPPNNPRRVRNLVNLTPLIDVVFILLIFLMLVSNFIHRGAVEFSASPESPAGAATADAAPVRLTLLDDDRVRLDGRDYAMSGIAPALRRAASGRDDPVVVVEAASGVTLQGVTSLLAAVRRVPGVKVSFADGGAAK